ncbi:MAG: HNH endonuclease [Acidobacteriota bacterium]
MPRKLGAVLREQVRQRANFLCEYCHTDEHLQCVRFTIDHLTPVSEGRDDSLENLG